MLGGLLARFVVFLVFTLAFISFWQILFKIFFLIFELETFSLISDDVRLCRMG